MKNIHKFITHTVNNLFPLNEFSDAEIKRLMDKFKEEADDLGIEITDDQLEKYINRFDQLKGSPKIEDKDLRRWPLSKLIKLVSSSEGADSEEETGPDVLYSEDGYTVYSGGSEELCQRHRNDVPWCITRGSFGNYRYSKDRNYPSFYLIKNTNLPESNKLSFVAIQVRDEDENRKYVWTPKDNSPNESSPMGWSKLTSDIPWLENIPNIKNILKNIPLSSKEKTTQIYSKSGSEISIRQWVSMPFNEKKQYLVVRKDDKIFNDITNEQFIADYLPKYPQLAAFAAVTPGLINPLLLLKNLDKFSVNDRKSITANLHNLVDTKELSKDILPFDVKKLLTALNKWNLKNDERIYVTKNGEAIVKLTFGKDINVGVFTAEDDYPNIKLNKRTAKFLLDYPKIDEIPFSNLIKLASEDIIDKDFITKVLQKAEQDPNSAIVVKDTENGKILLDSNSFTSYKIEGDKISSIPFSSEEVQNILASETENSGFQNSAVDLVFAKENIPDRIDKDSFLSILKNTPYNERIRDGRVIIPLENGIVVFNTDASRTNTQLFSYGFNNDAWNIFNRYGGNSTADVWREYFNYLRNKNFSYNDVQLISVLNGMYRGKKEFVEALPPMVADSLYKPVFFDDIAYLVNTENPRDSKRISDTSGKIIRAALSPAQASRALGTTTQAPAAQAQAVPAAAPRTPQAAAPAAPAGANDNVTAIIAGAGLTTGFNTLPTSIKSRIVAGTPTPYTRRNSAVDAIGRVTNLIAAGPSRFYILRLPSGTVVGFATMQPDARHYIVTGTRAYQVPRVNQLTSIVQRYGINEESKTLMRFHSIVRPEETNEIKQLLKKLTNKSNMKLQELKNIIKNEIRIALAEGATEVAPARPTTKPTTKPGKPGLIPDKDKNPKTKPKAKTNEAVSKGITDIVKKYKSLKKK